MHGKYLLLSAETYSGMVETCDCRQAVIRRQAVIYQDRVVDCAHSDSCLETRARHDPKDSPSLVANPMFPVVISTNNLGPGTERTERSAMVGFHGGGLRSGAPSIASSIATMEANL